ncbi:EPM2A-interacting protein 1 [Acipenser ruthenus]|uniref:EPM2A-interacting protein 1 n=1 Tax=Acipenser ruthenus TaxID=7906 RepID=A0A444UJ72_ACIRT|nr:EPM2A-interacting protein 1 [Acipenser ruthenus]
MEENLDTGGYAVLLTEVKENFESRFTELERLKKPVQFVENPFDFPVANAGEIAECLGIAKEDMENELLELQTEGRNYRGANAEGTLERWKCIEKTSLRNAAAKILSVCASTYTCESTFSVMGRIKTKLRSHLTDKHLEAELRSAVTSLDFETITRSVNAQQSH